MRIVLTGASGFIGSRLLRHLLRHPAYAAAEIIANDMRVSDPASPRVRVVEGDLADRAVMDALFVGEADIVFHLAGILGGAAEMDYALSRRVNVDTTLSLLEAIGRGGRCPRLVFCSTIAVFGMPMPPRVDDDTVPLPSMVYGAQKLMMEAAISQFSQKGWLDGLAVRLPGIVARRGTDSRQRAAFLNNVFYAYADGLNFTMPVSTDAAFWMISVPCCIENIVHAAGLPASRIGPRRAFTLSCQRVEARELVRALAERFPESRSVVSYAPEPELDALFGRYPPITTAIADGLGFRHDGDLRTLLERAMTEEGLEAA